jgi:ZIP family zinc transporter
MPLTAVEIGVLGAIAGFTVYLGLPVARVTVPDTVTGILNGLAIGILLFLLVEILLGVIEPIEHTIEETAVSGAPLKAFVVLAGIVGFTGGLVALATFDDRYITADADNRTLALMIAIGIGLHNFSERLAIGQSAASGALSLAVLLIIGFALHNITEGFGIAAPLTNETASATFLGLLGLIAGGAVFVGTLIGRLWTSQIAAVLFLALAGGALVYVIDELFRTATTGTSKTPVFVSVAVGFFAALGTELVIAIVSA